MKKHSFNQTRKPRCPVCGEVLLPDKAFCCACCTLLTADRTSPLPPEQVTDAQLQPLLDVKPSGEKTFRRRLADLLTVLSWLCLVPSLVMIFIKSWRGVGAVLALCWLGLIFLAGLASPPDPKDMLGPSQRRLLYANYLVPEAARSVFGPTVSYSAREKLSARQIPEGAFLLGSFDADQGGQLCRFVYRGLQAELSYAHLISIRRIEGKKQPVNVFRGYCLSVQTGLRPSAQLRLVEKHLGILRTPEDPEPETLEDIFHIHCTSPETVTALLTPELRRDLMTCYRNCPGTLGIVLQHDGRIFISVGEDREALTDGVPLDEVRALYRSMLTRPLQVLDCFLPR